MEQNTTPMSQTKLSEIQVDFQKIRDHAKANRWTTQQIAAEATGKLSQSTVSKILTGESRNPTAIRLKAICDVIGLPIQEVFTKDPIELS